MQISRHWRMNAQRYQLVGVRYENGEVSLQNRPTEPSADTIQSETEIVHTEATAERDAVVAAA